MRGGDPCGQGEVAESAGGAVAVQTVRTAVEQNRPAVAVPGCAFDGPRDRWWQWCQDVLVSLAAHQQDPVAVFLTEVVDVGAGGFEDPQPEEAEHRDQGEVAIIDRVAGGSQDRFELQVGQTQGGGLVGDSWSADVVGW
jgi:hypothetical protein